jgi:hypothetical protein
MSTRYLGRTDVGRRYNRCTRTIKRWEDVKILPPPDLIVGERKFWAETTLDEHDHKTTTSAKSAPQRRYNFATGSVTD